MWILRYGSILNKPRAYICGKSNILKELFNCSLCLGFWTGCLIGGIFFYLERDIHYALFPLVSSALCWFFDSLLDLIQLAANKLEEK